MGAGLRDNPGQFRQRRRRTGPGCIHAQGRRCLLAQKRCGVAQAAVSTDFIILAEHLSGGVDQGRASPQVGRAQGRFANCSCCAFAQDDRVGRMLVSPLVRFMLVTPSVYAPNSR